MTTTITFEKAIAVRTQVQGYVTRIKRGDETAHEELLTWARDTADEELGGFDAVQNIVGNLLEEAAEAHAENVRKAKAAEELAAQQDADKQTKDDQPWEMITAKDIKALANLLKDKKGQPKAAQLVVDYFTGKANLAEVVKTLDEVLPDCSLYGRAKWVSWEIRNRADNALKAAAEEEKAFGFLAPQLRDLELLKSDEYISEAGSKDKPGLQDIERRLRNARPSDEWGFWAKDALERLIKADRGDIAKAVGHELGYEAWKAIASNNGSSVLIDGVHKLVKAGVERHRQANRKAAEIKETARRQRQLDRSLKCQAMKGHNPSADSHKKGKKPGKKAK